MMIEVLANLFSHSRNTNMRSNLFAATLTIALGVVSPIVGAIGFPAVAAVQTVDNRIGEADRLRQQGKEQFQRGQVEAALQSWQQALKLYRETKNRQGEGKVIHNLGAVFGSRGNYQQAIDYFEQSLAIARELGNRDHERLALNYIGLILERQHKLDLAIGSYRQSINVSESIRKDNRSLSQDRQNSYTKTVAETYHHLAKLLVYEGKVLEAVKIVGLIED